jgi:chromatin modification-related protein YNG2
VFSPCSYCCTFVRTSLLTHPELLSRINSRHQGLTRHLRNLLSNPNSGTTTPTFQLPLPAGSELPTSHLSNKDAQAVIKIQGEWGKIEVLQEEKIKLAERMERIVNRARERGKAEWRKVGGMDPDEIEAAENKVLLGDMGSAEVVLPPTGLGTGSDRPFKSTLTLASSLRFTDSLQLQASWGTWLTLAERKPNALPLPLPSFTQPIVHPPSSMPPPPAPVRTALPSRRKHERQPSASTISEPDADGEGEIEAAEAGDTEADDTLYCLCQQKSYGEMIGCDNDKCEYEWVSRSLRSLRLLSLCGTLRARSRPRMRRLNTHASAATSRSQLTVLPVPRQMRQYQWSPAGHMVLSRLRQEARLHLERRQGGGSSRQEGQEAMIGGH